MSEKRWYRSLYWRVALGLVAFLALMIVAQSALFVWTLEQTAGSMPARSPRRLAVLIASDVAAAIGDNPTLNLTSYVQQQYSEVFQPFAVMMRDGRVVSNRGAVPEELAEAARIETQRQERFAQEGRRVQRSGERRLPPGGRRGGPPQRGWEIAPILVNGMPAGRVVVLATAPLPRIVRELGPTMAWIAAVVLGSGIVFIALFIFGPARRRLKHLETTAERLGSGDLTARAEDRGGDEVASVARAFNRMAEELRARIEALNVSERARRHMLADVSHELTTPLTAMRGYVETLKMREIDLDAATRDRYLDIIEAETHRLERLVGDLLDLARLEGGGGTLRHEHVSVAELFARVADRHERDIQARGDRIIANVDPGADFLEGDPDRLEQALENLVSNALRHTKPGTDITLSSRLAGDRIHLQVRDSGVGIPAEHLPLVFDRFYKADASRHDAGGSGLGLSIVKAIIERHGGTITARNDGGAIFDIALPAAVTTGR